MKEGKGIKFEGEVDVEDGLDVTDVGGYVGTSRSRSRSRSLGREEGKDGRVGGRGSKRFCEVRPGEQWGESRVTAGGIGDIVRQLSPPSESFRIYSCRMRATTYRMLGRNITHHPSSILDAPATEVARQ